MQGFSGIGGGKNSEGRLQRAEIRLQRSDLRREWSMGNGCLRVILVDFFDECLYLVNQFSLEFVMIIC